MREKENNYFKDVFYIMALALVVLGGCATPLGKFNKQEKVVENIQQEKTNNDNKKVESNKLKGSLMKIQGVNMSCLLRRFLCST